MNYWERHIGDYIKDTSHLSLLEHGIYTRLLDVYYTRESAIPDELAARLISARSKDEREALAVVLGEFFTLTDGVWAHIRCDAEIEKFQAKVVKNREVGKLGGRPKKQEPKQNQDGFEKEPKNNHGGYFQEPKQNPPQTPVTRHQTPDTAEAVIVGGSESAHPHPNPGDVCKAMRMAGLADVNPSSPKLLALLAAGMTQDELVQAAVDAVKSQKPYPYALATAEGRRNDAAKVVLAPKSTVNRQEALEQRNRATADEWAKTGEIYEAN